MTILGYAVAIGFVVICSLIIILQNQIDKLREDKVNYINLDHLTYRFNDLANSISNSNFYKKEIADNKLAEAKVLIKELEGDNE